MTLDEAIKHCEEKAEENRKKADEWYAGGCSFAQAEGNNCLNCANEHEQLAEWLKDYKRMKEERLQGDLISRESLKEELELSKYIIPNDLNRLLNSEINRCIETIDNAPTVEAYPFEQVQELVNLNFQFAEEIENLKRPQGEWITTWEHDVFICSNCGEVSVTFTNFCPNCGASMMTGEKE